MVHEHHSDYYRAIKASTAKIDAAPFIAFMLTMILASTPQVTPQVKELLLALKNEMSRDDLQNALGLQDRKSFSERYLKPALNAGLIEMTIRDKPNSRLQKYRITQKGQKLNSRSV